MSQAVHQADDVTCTDADLVALLRAGDEEAISQLVERWSPAMFRLARSFVASPQSAEDVVQEAWLGMLSGLARFEGRSSLRTWTFTILVNRARTRGAREARTVPQPPLAARGEHSGDDMAADLSGRAALITGAASGIGRASAVAFASAGASVALLDIDATASRTPRRPRGRRACAPKRWWRTSGISGP